MDLLRQFKNKHGQAEKKVSEVAIEQLSESIPSEINEAIASRSEIEREKSEERTAMEYDGGLWSNIILNDMLDDAAGSESLDTDAPKSPSGDNATIAAAPGIQEVEAQERELDELLDQLRRVNRHWKIEWARKKNVPMKALLHAAAFWLSDDPDDWTAANDTIFAFTSHWGHKQLCYRRSEKVVIPQIGGLT